MHDVYTLHRFADIFGEVKLSNEKRWKAERTMLAQCTYVTDGRTN